MQFTPLYSFIDNTVIPASAIVPPLYYRYTFIQRTIHYIAEISGLIMIVLMCFYGKISSNIPQLFIIKPVIS